MTAVAVVAHQGKSFDGGLDELRSRLADAGVAEPLWFEVPKSRKAPARALEAVDRGADLIFVWGGDGMVQRCVDALAGKPVTIAILPAGTANLLATNLGVPKSLAEAVEVGLRGRRRSLDVGVINGERFAVMAGAGFDALMIRDADAGLKDKAGRLAYVWTGARNLGAEAVKTRIKVDGHAWFKGRASCVLVGNVGTISGGFTAFADARPDDGHLDLGVVTAKGALQWSRVLARLATGKLDRSAFTQHTPAHKIVVKFAQKVTYELDGGARGRTKRLEVRIEPGAIEVAVPDEDPDMSTASVVPETWELTGDDALATIRHTGRGRLLKDAFMRMRVADGFSHSRSLAFMTSLVLVQGTIVIVGTAAVLGDNGFSRGIISAIQNAAPGPAGQVLTTAAHHAHSTGVSRRYLALVLGLIGTLVAATTAMGQLERGLNRIYGVEQDRPMTHKYGLAFVLAVTAGILIFLAFVAVGFGFEVGDALHNQDLNEFWSIVRWPVGLLLLMAAMALLFQRCPRRRQPGWSWLAFGSAVSVLLWFAITLVMGLVFQQSKSFGTTYGPLAGIVALQMWAMLSAMAVLYGGAVAAQLEAVRAGSRPPQDPSKVAESEPESADARAEPVGVS